MKLFSIFLLTVIIASLALQLPQVYGKQLYEGGRADLNIHLGKYEENTMYFTEQEFDLLLEDMVKLPKLFEDIILAKMKEQLVRHEGDLRDIYVKSIIIDYRIKYNTMHILISEEQNHITETVKVELKGQYKMSIMDYLNVGVAVYANLRSGDPYHAAINQLESQTLQRVQVLASTAIESLKKHRAELFEGKLYGDLIEDYPALANKAIINNIVMNMLDDMARVSLYYPETARIDEGITGYTRVIDEVNTGASIDAGFFSGNYFLWHNGKLYEIPYTISDAMIRSISLEDDFETILISLFENHRYGSLEITLPRELVVNWKRGEINEPIVVIDSKEAKVDVLYRDEDVITIKFDLPAQSENISIMKTILFSTSDISLNLSNDWVSRGDMLIVNGSFSELRTDAESADFVLTITGPLPMNQEVFSDIITINNGGNFSYPFKVEQTIQPGKYNITIFPADKRVTNATRTNFFVVSGPAFVPMYIRYEADNSIVYVDTSSVMFLDTNSSRYRWESSAETKTLRMSVVGEEGTRGYMTLVIPKESMDGIKDVRFYKQTVPIMPLPDSQYMIEGNSTHTIITMNYPHIGREIPIVITGTTMVPEFPVNLMVITAVGLIVTLIASRFKGRILPKKL
ncbi:MAG: hypothetical protein HMLIMOIP_001861 [Candidatus Nitrosomirales archaeon]